MSKRDASAGGRGPRRGRAGEDEAHAAAADPAAEAAAVDQLSFESALEQLEAVVDRLEEGELALENALASYEQGVRLARRCAGQLESAQRRIEILTNEGAEWVARPFEPEPAGDVEEPL